MAGKRKRYFNPCTFLMLVLGVAVFVNTAPLHEAPHSAPPAPPTTLSRAEALHLREKQVETFFRKRVNIVAFLAIPLVALIFSVFFGKTGLGYAEHLVANVLFAGAYLLLTDLLLVPGLRLLHVKPEMIGLIVTAFHICCLTFAYSQFLGSHYK